MDKLSKLYRDDAEGIDPQLRSDVDRVFLPTLEYLDTKNPRLLVVFSGGNATGKSALSSKLAEEFKGLVLENDGIKRAILSIKPDIDSTALNVMTWQYSMDLYRRLPVLTNNGLIIRDGIIDWYFDRVLPLFEAAGYELFIIQYDISKEKAAELIRARGDTPTVTANKLLLMLDDHAIHQQRFRSMYQANVILHENNIFDHDKVIQKLKNTILSK